MNQLAHALLLGVALSAVAAPAHRHATMLPMHPPARIALAASVASAGKSTPPYGLAFSGEMLFGGVVLMAGSAYALRRSRH